MTTAEGKRQARAPWWRVALLVGLVTGGTAAVALAGVGEVDRLRAWIAGAGLLAPVVFAVLFAAVTLSFVPKSAAGAAAGLLFGFPVGLGVTLAGGAMGGTAAFWLARWLGREAIERWTGARMERLDALMRRRGFAGVLLARLAPALPFSGISYASGLSAVGFLPYFAGTMLGTLPGSSIQVAVGAYGVSPSSWQFLAAVAALLVLSGLGVLWRRRRRGRGRKVASKEPGSPHEGASA